MKTLKWYSDTIKDEIEGAEKYAKASLYTKHTDPEASRLCAEVAKQEVNHADMFHQQGAKEYKKLKEKPHLTEEERLDLMMWELNLGHIVEHMGKVKALVAGL